MARIEGAGRADLFNIDPEIVTIPESGPLFDERTTWPVNENLVANIRYHGQIQPIVVRKNGPALEVVSGRQRLKAIREINRQARERGEMTMKIQARLIHGTDAEHYGLMISENEIRRDDDPLTKTAKAKRLLHYGLTAKDIAVIFGVQVRAVNEWLSLTDVAPEVKKAIQDGEIAAGVGVALAELPREEQAAKLAEWQATGEGKPVTVHKARREVRTRSGAPPRPRMRSPREIRSMLDELCRKPINETTLEDRCRAETLEWVLNEIETLGEADALEGAQATGLPVAPPVPASTGQPAAVPPPRLNGGPAKTPGGAATIPPAPSNGGAAEAQI